MKPKLYDELATWWPLLSRPEDYEEEAALYVDILTRSGDPPAQTLLELGSGGGNNASFLKAWFRMTLVDLSPGMLAVSRKLNPECEHGEGDMRTVRLGREFDRVFVHDAIAYMTGEVDLRRAVETAFVHCRRGGAALFVPDHVAETFRPSTSHGGHDGTDRALRYLEWTGDPEPDDTTYTVDFAVMLREPDGKTRVVYDRHTCGLFTGETWLGILEEVGFTARAVPLSHSEIEPGTWEGFLGIKP